MLFLSRFLKQADWAERDSVGDSKLANSTLFVRALYFNMRTLICVSQSVLNLNTPCHALQINTLHSSLAAYRHVYLAQEEENYEKSRYFGDL